MQTTTNEIQMHSFNVGDTVMFWHHKEQRNGYYKVIRTYPLRLVVVSLEDNQQYTYMARRATKVGPND
jgi:hypothetical protein